MHLLINTKKNNKNRVVFNQKNFKDFQIYVNLSAEKEAERKFRLERKMKFQRKEHFYEEIIIIKVEICQGERFSLLFLTHKVHAKLSETIFTYPNAYN